MTDKEKQDIQFLFEAMGRTDAKFCIGQVVGSQTNNFYGGERAAARDAETPGQQTVQRREFGLLLRSGHSEQEMALVVEKLQIGCSQGNSRALMRLLCQLEKDGYVDLQDVKAAELYHELQQSFEMNNITEKSFAESYRLIG